MASVVMQLSLYAKLMRLDKPIGILLLLWPTLWALWLAANGVPNLKILIIFIAGVILMRSAGCVINDVADRNYDAHVTRTAQRPLAQRQLSTTQALILFSILLLLAAGLLLMLNRLCAMLAVIGALVTLIYPFTKRYLQTPQLVLGVAFAWGIPMAYAAVLNTVPANGWLLFLIGVIWPVIYDTMYAMVDRHDDLKIGIKSTAILLGRYDRVIIGVLQLCWFALWLLLARRLVLPAIFYVSLLIALGLSAYQQFLIAQRDPAQCFRAFLNNHWLGLVIFGGLGLSVL